MSAPIKFRIWHSQTSRFLENHQRKSDPMAFDLWGWADKMSDCLIYLTKEYTFQQFTGLTDSKGKDIYEGDIIKETHFEDWKDETGYDYFGVVKHVVYTDKTSGHQFSRYSSFPKLEEMTGYAGHPICVKCEVIGNISGFPCRPDHNGECLICDCWLSDCPMVDLVKLDKSKKD
jgi:uncharacterized phage protein (TIGR01671 family)